MKVVNKKAVMDWYNNQTEEVKQRLYVHQYCEASAKASVYLKYDGESKDVTIFKIGRKGLKWFDLLEQETPYVNLILFKVNGLTWTRKV